MSAVTALEADAPAIDSSRRLPELRDDGEELVVTEVECDGEIWTGEVVLPSSCSMQVSDYLW